MALKHAVFHCVYYFDGSAEEFILAGAFSKKDDASEFKAELEKDAAPGSMPTYLAEMTMEGIKRHLLQGLVEQSRSLLPLLEQAVSVVLENEAKAFRLKANFDANTARDR